MNLVAAKFIVIEGLEGAGKSTALQQLKALIETSGQQVITTREPGGTEMAEAIRKVVERDIAPSLEAVRRLYSSVKE